MQKVAKSKKLQREEAKGQASSTDFPVAAKVSDKLKIKKVTCYNDWVAVLRFVRETPLELAQHLVSENFGVVIGIGPGAPGLPPLEPRPEVGQVVLFHPRSVIITMSPNDGVYAGQAIVFINAVNIFCQMPPVPYELVEDEAT